MKPIFERSRIQILILASLALLLLAVPLTIQLLRHQQNQLSKATPATVLSFEPLSQDSSPLQKNPSESFPLDIMLDPGTNQVSTVTLFISYDPSKLSIDQSSTFQTNPAVFPTILEGPLYSTGQIAVQLSIGSDPTRAITQKAKAGTLHFTAIDGTGNLPTTVSFTSQTSALSIGPNEGATENVIQATLPAYIAISGPSTNPTSTPPPSPFPTIQASPTPPPSVTPTIPSPTSPQQTPVPTVTGGPQPTIPITPLPTGTGSNNPRLFRRFLSVFLQNRIINMKNIIKKILKGRTIPPRQIQRLEKENETIATYLKQLILLVQQSQNAPSASQPEQTHTLTSKILGALLNEYQSVANKLDTFSQGLQGVINERRTQNIDVSAEQKHLQDIQASVKYINLLIIQSQNLLNTMTGTNMYSVITDVQRNLRKIKSEFVKVKVSLRKIGVAMRK